MEVEPNLHDFAAAQHSRDEYDWPWTIEFEESLPARTLPWDVFHIGDTIIRLEELFSSWISHICIVDNLRSCG